MAANDPQSMTLETKIDTVVAALSKPPTLEERADGWTAANKASAREMFAGIKRKLAVGDPIPPVSLSRALDSWGIVSGELLELSAEISNELRARRENTKSP